VNQRQPLYKNQDPTAGKFVSYGDETFRITDVHLTGVVSCDHWTGTPLTPTGCQIFSRLPAHIETPKMVREEHQRLRRPSPLQFLRCLKEEAQREGLHVIAALTYEAAHIHEDLPLPRKPFLEFFITSVSTDNRAFQPSPQMMNDARRARPASQLVSDSSPHFFANFARSEDFLRAGDIFEIVLSRRFQFECNPQHMSFFLASTMEHRMAPYRFVLDFPNTILLGASPELLVKVSGQTVTNRPISGSLRRSQQGGPLSSEELRQFDVLLHSEKEKSELDMLIDLSRHDLHRVCNGVHIKNYRESLVLETVAHTQATVTGQLKPEFDSIDALFSCLNAGTLVGAPKKKAMEIIAELEPEPRGYYGGNLVHIFPNGDLRAIILIRTAILQKNILTIQAGATVLLGASADYEFWECGAKARSLLAEIGHEDLCYRDGTPPPIVDQNTVNNPRDAFTGTFSEMAARTQPIQIADTAPAKTKTDEVKAPSPANNKSLSLLMIDNQDSFTFNVVALFESLGCDLTVVRNDSPMPRWEDMDGLLLSPGPSSPRDAGFLLDIVKACAGRIPVFGVCLGMQAMIEALGGELSRMTQPLHGKCRPVHIVGECPYFMGISTPFAAARYHSLHGIKIPPPLKIVAVDDNGIVMAVEGAAHWPPFFGVQFHPESFLTGETGVHIAQNWLDCVRRERDNLTS